MSSTIMKSWTWVVTPARCLRPGDVFMSDSGSGLLAYVGPARKYGHGYAPTSAEVRTVDMTGRLVTLIPGSRVRVFDPADLPFCDACVCGCYCDRTKGDSGCEHFGCYVATTDEPTCDGALRQRVELWSGSALRRGLHS
jgi:hypothetical protein